MYSEPNTSEYSKHLIINWISSTLYIAQVSSFYNCKIDNSEKSAETAYIIFFLFIIKKFFLKIRIYL